jgi:hypothetical protein
LGFALPLNERLQLLRAVIAAPSRNLPVIPDTCHTPPSCRTRFGIHQDFAVRLFPEKTFQVSKTWKVSEPDSIVPPHSKAVMVSGASPQAPAQGTIRLIGLLLLSRQTRRNKNH